jgi:oxygen-independent coproporphyrinogen-3 oxidase
MYEWAGEAFEVEGFVQYEISNWARENRQCRHNLQYWRGLPYLGLGAGAHGYSNNLRYSNVLRIKTYIERWEEPQEFVNENPAPEIVDRAAMSLPPVEGLLKTKFNFPLTPATVNFHHQTPQDDMSEFMITGLRLTNEGVSLNTFQQRFEREMLEVYGKEIEELTRLALLEIINTASEAFETSEAVRLTVRGRLLGNQVFLRFV